MSIAGGYHRAVEAAAELGMDCVQIFTKNNNQWTGKPLTDADIAEFRATLDRTGVKLPCSHDSYLINLASPDPALWQKSLEAYIIELERAEALGCLGVVMHPGSHVSSTADEGLAKIIEALNQAHWKPPPAREPIWAGGSKNCSAFSRGCRNPSGPVSVSTPAIFLPLATSWGPPRHMPPRLTNSTG
jgi:deoxyribonuclease-4